MSDSFGLPSTHRPLSATTANTGWPAAATRPSSIWGTCVATPSIGDSDLGVAQVALGVVESRLRLHVFGELVDRGVEAAAELDHGRRLLVVDEFEDLLGLDEGGERRVAVDARARAAGREVVLAVEVGLADLDRVLAHLDLVLLLT